MTRKKSGLGRKLGKVVVWIVTIHLVLGTIGYIAIQTSPRPAVAMIRYAFGLGGKAIAAGLQKHIPSDVSAILDQRYDDSENALLDVYFPTAVVSSTTALPTIVWIHGGGFVAGDKAEIQGYLRVLASRGFTVVGINYALAPEHRYPLPLQQVGAALRYLKQNASRLHVGSRFVLAGDSAGAHIAAQYAIAVSSADYAGRIGLTPAIVRSELTAMVLYCGPYDFESVRIQGVFGQLLKAMPWSYTGVKNFVDDPRFDSISLPGFVTAEFPPAFISAGNADHLELQSKMLAKALADRGVYTDTLFFPADHQPALPHEYQFNLDTEAGKLALDRSLSFLRAQLDGADTE